MLGLAMNTVLAGAGKRIRAPLFASNTIGAPVGTTRVGRETRSAGVALAGACGLTMSGAASSDKGDPLRTDMFGMHLAGCDHATVTDTERCRFASTGDRDLSANHHDACVPVMRVLGVHLTCF